MQNQRQIKYYPGGKVKTSPKETTKQEIKEKLQEKGFRANILKEKNETPLLLASRSRYLANDKNWQPIGSHLYYEGVSAESWKFFIYGLRPIALNVYQAYSDILGLDWEKLVEYKDKIYIHKAPELKKILFGHQGCVSSVAIHPQKNIIATGSWDKTIILWNLETQEKLRILEGHNDQVTAVCFSNSGGELLSSSYDQTLRFWNLIENYQDQNLFKPFFDVETNELCEIAAFSANGKFIVSGGSGNNIYLWRTWQFLSKLHTTLPCPDSVISLNFSPDSNWLAVGCANGVIRLWKLNNNPISYQDLETDAQWVTSLTFSRDNQYLFAGLKNGKITIWELITSTLIPSELVLHNAPVSALAIHPYQPNILVSGDMRGLICLWNWTESKPMYSFPGHRIFTTALCFTLDGEWLVSGGGDNTAKLWQLS